MTPERWEQIERLYHSALERDPGERESFLDRACVGDDELRREISSLLAHDGLGDSFIAAPALADAAQLLAGDPLMESTATPLDAPAVAKDIGPYKLQTLLGRGGMGEVHLALDTRLNRKVAVKLLPAEFTQDVERLRRFKQEARVASALNHPNVVTIYDIGEANGMRYLVMEYVEGETLRRRMAGAPQQRMKPAEAFALAAQAAEALSAAHEAGITHRDIKPENVMIRRDGMVKVLDFGLARLTLPAGAPVDSQAPTAAKMVTASGVVMGTASYMSPEQARGLKVDQRTDIFSLGVMMYEMLAGRRPFEGSTMSDVIAAILTREPEPLKQSGVDAPAGLERIVMRCLEKDQERRYQTARELAGDLEQVRSECESGQAATSISDEAKARDKAPVARRRVEWRTILGPRVALATIVLLTLAVAAYALFFRGPALAPTSGDKPYNSSAYDDYVRGKVNVSSQNRESNEDAIKLLEQAVKTDPRFAPAWAELARAYVTKAFYYALDAEKKRLNVNAEVAVVRALDLNPNLAEGHSVKGFLLWSPAKGFPHEQAVQCYKRALELNPKLDEAHHQLAVVYIHIGLFDKAWSETRNAVDINPNNTLARFRFGVINLYQGKYDEALSVFKSIPRDVNPSLLNRTALTALFQLGRFDEAGAIVEELLKNGAEDEGGAVTSVKAMLLAKAGKQSEAEKTIQRAIEIGKGFGHFHHTAYNIASAYALLNQSEQAIKWLRIAAEYGFPCYPFFEIDHNMNSLRNDAKFRDFMEKLRQQWERYKATL